MRRVLQFLVVGLLSVISSGALELVVPEPCTTAEAAAPQGDGLCPPTCLQCHCARPFDVVVTLQLVELSPEPIEWLAPPTAVVLPATEDILHVPRPALA